MIYDKNEKVKASCSAHYSLPPKHCKLKAGVGGTSPVVDHQMFEYEKDVALEKYANKNGRKEGKERELE